MHLVYKSINCNSFISHSTNSLSLLSSLYSPMDSKANTVVQNQVQENDEHHLHNVDPQQEVHSEEQQEHDNEAKSVFSKVKAKAKKIKNSIKKHGQNVFDSGHDHDNEDPHITDDHEGQQLHGIHESEGVRSAAPTSEKVENLEKSEVNFEETNEKARGVDVFPTTEIEEQHITEQGKTFVGEDPPKYNQTKLTDLSGTSSEEIDIAEVEKSIERVNVQDEKENVTETKSASAQTGRLNQFVPDPYTEQVENLKNSEANFDGKTVLGEEPNQEPQVVHVDPTAAINQNITTDQAKTFLYEQNSEQPFKEDSHRSGSRDEAYTPPEAAGNEEIGITEVEKSFERIDVEDEVKHSPEPKLFPNVSETQYPPTATESHNQLVSEISTPTETENPSAESHDYIPELSSAAKTQYHSDEIDHQFVQDFSTAAKTQDRDRFDPETISIGTNRDHEISEATEQTFHNNESGDAANKSDFTAEYGKNIDQSLNEKLGPEYREVAKTGSGSGAETENEVKEESSVQSPGKGVVGKLKDVYGSWFGKTEENQSTQGDEGLTKNEKSGVEVEQINKAEG